MVDTSRLRVTHRRNLPRRRSTNAHCWRTASSSLARNYRGQADVFRAQELLPMSHDADYWQKRAIEVRAEAEKTSRPEDKRELLEIVAGYEQLARERSAPANLRARIYRRLAHTTQDRAGRARPRSR